MKHPTIIEPPFVSDARRFVILAAAILDLLVALSTPAWAALVMTQDGTSTDCIFDSTQVLKIQTDRGDASLQIMQIVWMAGRDPVRVRLDDGRLLTGTFASDAEIRYKTDTGTTTLQLNTIAFYYRESVDLHKVGRLVIEEWNGGVGRVTTSPGDANGTLKVELVPENWDSNLEISKPVYQTKVANTSAFRISFTANSTNPDTYLDKELRLALRITGFGKQSVTSTMRWPFKNKGTALAVANTVDLPKSVFSSAFVQFSGTGVILAFVISFPETEATYAGGNLVVVRTLSNVLPLPITIY